MIYTFSLSKISTVIEWLEKYDKVEGLTPKQFVREHLSVQKFLIDKNLKPFSCWQIQVNETVSIIYESMQNRFSDDVITVLLGLIDDQCQLLFQSKWNGDEDRDNEVSLQKVF